MGTQVPEAGAEQSLTQMVEEILPEVTIDDLGLQEAFADATRKVDVPDEPASKGSTAARDEAIRQNGFRVLGNTGSQSSKGAVKAKAAEDDMEPGKKTPPASPPTTSR